MRQRRLKRQLERQLKRELNGPVARIFFLTLNYWTRQYFLFLLEDHVCTDLAKVIIDFL